MNNKLNGHWITGFTDAEGCFSVQVVENSTHVTGWAIKPVFTIKLHKRDKELLIKIRSYFEEAGIVFIRGKFAHYNVHSKKEIMEKIIPHFNKYSLITRKQKDFLIFKEILNIIDKKEHLNNDGLSKIIELKSSLNKGLSDKLKGAFLDINRVEKLLSNSSYNINPYWFSGFFSGEGCFFIEIGKSRSSKRGYYVRLRLTVSQHIKDELLIKDFVSLFNCGYIYIYKDSISYSISKFKDIYNLFSFFEKYKIEGVKYLDYLDFYEAAKIIKNKDHLSDEGFHQIMALKNKMNKYNDKFIKNQ